MTESTSCPYSQNGEIDQHYLAGTLPESDAETFERHYFECDICWARLQRGAEIRAALWKSQPSSLPVQSSPVTRRRMTIRVMPATAAAVLLVGLGIWRNSRVMSHSPRVAAREASETTRGSEMSFNVATRITDGRIVAAWPPTSGAVDYRVRLLAQDGTLLLEREVSDTSFVLPADSVPGAKTASRYWHVQALNELRSIIATSSLTPVRPASDSI